MGASVQTLILLIQLNLALDSVDSVDSLDSVEIDSVDSVLDS